MAAERGVPAPIPGLAQGFLDLYRWVEARPGRSTALSHLSVEVPAAAGGGGSRVSHVAVLCFSLEFTPAGGIPGWFARANKVGLNAGSFFCKEPP